MPRQQTVNAGLLAVLDVIMNNKEKQIVDTEILRVVNLNTMGRGSLYEALLMCCSQTNLKQRAICFDVAGTIKFPEDSAWVSDIYNGARITGLRNVVVCGDSAPGRIVITGHPYCLEDMNDVIWKGITWALEAPANKAFASSWGPVRCVSNVGKTSRNVTFSRCSFVGGEDETPFGSSDWKERKRFVTDYEVPAFYRLNFDRCFFGLGTSVHRNGHHNFGLMIQCAERSVVAGCLFAHCNRRSPQIEGFKNIVIGNTVYNYGSMAFGCTSGDTTLINNLFIPGNSTKQSMPQTLPIQVTPTSGDVTRKGSCVFSLYGNHRLAYGKISESTANDASMCDNQMAGQIEMRVNSLTEPRMAMIGNRLLSVYPTAISNLDRLHEAGAPGCPYAAMVRSQLDVPALKKPWVPGAIRNGHWIKAVSGRLADFQIKFPSPSAAGIDIEKTYEELLAGLAS